MDTSLTALQPYEDAVVWCSFASPVVVVGVRTFLRTRSAPYALVGAAWFGILSIVGVVAAVGGLYLFHSDVPFFLVPSALNILAFLYPIKDRNVRAPNAEQRAL